eukprot:scaffold35109_cov69-Phaeocystis_antarctica.AAC.1
MPAAPGMQTRPKCISSKTAMAATCSREQLPPTLGGRVEVFMECWSATELGPRSRRARDRRAAPSRGGMRRNILLQAKTLLTHPSGRRLSFSRYWARLKPRSESLARLPKRVRSAHRSAKAQAARKPPERAGARGRPPTIRSAASGPGGRWGSVVLGWRALRPPRVVFVIGVASLINSLTSGKTRVSFGYTWGVPAPKSQSKKSVYTRAGCRQPEPSPERPRVCELRAGLYTGQCNTDRQTRRQRTGQPGTQSSAERKRTTGTAETPDTTHGVLLGRHHTARQTHKVTNAPHVLDIRRERTRTCHTAVRSAFSSENCRSSAVPAPASPPPPRRT